MAADTSMDLLRRFRTQLYGCLGRRRDELFELTDALLCIPAVTSPPYLSLAPPHRRRWASVYAALTAGTVDAPALQDLLTRFRPASWPAIFAVDTSIWPRCDAECSPERGLYYHPSRHSAGQPIVAGWCYSWIAGLSFERDSWTSPVDIRRVPVGHTGSSVAVAQIQALLARLGAAQTVPLFVFDAGYDPLALQLGLASTPASILVRVRSNRCFYFDPPARAVDARGRPRRHGAKFACIDPATWPEPDAVLTVTDASYGHVNVAAWSGLHPKPQCQPGHGSRAPRPIARGTLIRIQVTRLPRPTRPPQVLWLWWAGPGTVDLDLAWRAYVRRFDLEHTLRFCKQTLAWTTPRLRHPEQADRWTDLVAAAYAQLGLARACVSDRRLPWERPRPAGMLSPVRVRRGFPALLVAVGSPARAPKPTGRSPGRPKGRTSGRAPRHPAVKKAA
jgi:hypothetical protein